MGVLCRARWASAAHCPRVIVCDLLESRVHLACCPLSSKTVLVDSESLPGTCAKV